MSVCMSSPRVTFYARCCVEKLVVMQNHMQGDNRGGRQKTHCSLEILQLTIDSHRVLEKKVTEYHWKTIRIWRPWPWPLISCDLGQAPYLPTPRVSSYKMKKFGEIVSKIFFSASEIVFCLWISMSSFGIQMPLCAICFLKWSITMALCKTLSKVSVCGF